MTQEQSLSPVTKIVTISNLSNKQKKRLAKFKKSLENPKKILLIMNKKAYLLMKHNACLIFLPDLSYYVRLFNSVHLNLRKKFGYYENKQLNFNKVHSVRNLIFLKELFYEHVIEASSNWAQSQILEEQSNLFHAIEQEEDEISEPTEEKETDPNKIEEEEQTEGTMKPENVEEQKKDENIQNENKIEEENAEEQNNDNKNKKSDVQIKNKEKEKMKSTLINKNHHLSKI